MIKRFQISNCMGLPDYTYNNPGNVNVIIGQNDTGKTSLLKLLYSTVRAWEEYSNRKELSPKAFRGVLSEKLNTVFRPGAKGLGALVTSGSPDKLKCDITVKQANGDERLYFSFGKDAVTYVGDHMEPASGIIDNEINSIFIPAKEVLSIWNVILASKNEFVSGFDDTYSDLVNAILTDNLRGRPKKELSKVQDSLEKVFEGKIVFDPAKQQFTFRKGRFDYSMEMTAEGIKNIGILTNLISKRRIKEGTILFLDEPDSNLHPKAIAEFAEMLTDLAKGGVQLFMTTHSYFLVKKLSIIASREQFDMNYISLERLNGRTEIIEDNLKYGMPMNSIIQTSIDLFNEELAI